MWLARARPGEGSPASRLGRRRRARQVTGVLVRHGLGWVAGGRRLGRLIPFHRGLLGHARRPVPYTRPEHVRLAIEDLGAAFVKLGQIASTRPDVLPPAYEAELARLQDAAPAEPWDAIRAVLDAELGGKTDALFAGIDSVPLAAASIGQAHAAILSDGTEVIVKVRRPGVVELVEVDLDLLAVAARRAARRWDPDGRYDLPAVAAELAATLRSELDYRQEAANAARFAAQFAGRTDVRIPRVFPAVSTQRVLTLERLRGLRVDDLAGLDAAGIDRVALADRAAGLLLEMVYTNGFFHADPHPGNLFIQPDGAIGLVDFGMVGEIEPERRVLLAGLLLAIAGRDPDAVGDSFLALGGAPADVDRVRLQADLVDLLTLHLDRPLGEVSIGRLLQDLMAVVRRHHLRLPPALALLAKTIAMAEGIGTRLDPSFRLLDAMARFTAVS